MTSSERPMCCVGDDGQAYIVDWSAGLLEREFRFLPARLIYKRFLLDDRHAVIKFQLRHCPEAIRSEDLRRYQDRRAAERAIRKLRDRARGLSTKNGVTRRTETPAKGFLVMDRFSGEIPCNR